VSALVTPVRILFLLQSPVAHRDLHSFPTRRSSDLGPGHVYIELASPDAVTALRPDTDALLELSPYGTVCFARDGDHWKARVFQRSEEHTSELQSLRHLVCRLLLEKKKKKNKN